MAGQGIKDFGRAVERGDGAGVMGFVMLGWVVFAGRSNCFRAVSSPEENPPGQRKQITGKISAGQKKFQIKFQKFALHCKREGFFALGEILKFVWGGFCCPIDGPGVKIEIFFRALSGKSKGTPAPHFRSPVPSLPCPVVISIPCCVAKPMRSGVFGSRVGLFCVISFMRPELFG